MTIFTSAPKMLPKEKGYFSRKKFDSVHIIYYTESRAVDPHSFFADPDPAVFLNADPDPGGKMNADLA